MTLNTGYPVRKPLRLRGFDYATAGLYFITICTQDMECRFGDVENGGVRLNDAGAIIDACWQENARRYPGTELDVYVIMPNHLHAIVFLGTDTAAGDSASLSRIVQTFKSQSTVAYTRGVRDRRFAPFDRVLWQRGFHDRILRNQRELEAARAYIEANPARYAEMRNHRP